MSTGAILLSGGASSRFGGFPKALVSAGERSVIHRMAELSLDQGYDPVLVVVGPHHRPISEELRGMAVELVDSEQWFEGRTASVQSGVRAPPPTARRRPGAGSTPRRTRRDCPGRRAALRPS
ncbi:MAG: nucleotidyltransferase family protein, partial [Thermoplasmata archaeon]